MNASNYKVRRRERTVVALASLCFGLLLGACGGEDPTPSRTIHGEVVLAQVADLTEADIKALPPTLDAAIQAGGWVRTERGLERYKPLTPGLFATHNFGSFGAEINGVPIRLAEDGSFTAERVPLNPSPAIVVLKVGDDELGSTSAAHMDLVENADGSSNIMISWHKLYGGHDHGDAPSEHDHAAAGHEPVGQQAQALRPDFTCRDYNGPFGNCRNYSSGWRKYWNFIGSDCEAAWFKFGLCWLDLAKKKELSTTVMGEDSSAAEFPEQPAIDHTEDEPADTPADGYQGEEVEGGDEGAPPSTEMPTSGAGSSTPKGQTSEVQSRESAAASSKKKKGSTERYCNANRNCSWMIGHTYKHHCH